MQMYTNMQPLETSRWTYQNLYTKKTEFIDLNKLNTDKIDKAIHKMRTSKQISSIKKVQIIKAKNNIGANTTATNNRGII